MLPYRRLLFILTLLSLAAQLLAAKIQERFHTVVNLTPAEARVDLFVAFTGLPAGKTLTYVLPMPEQPQQFSQKAEYYSQFYGEHVIPVHQQESRIGLIRERYFLKEYARAMPRYGLGLAGFIPSRARERARSTKLGWWADHPFLIIPQDPLAHTKLYRIDTLSPEQFSGSTGLPCDLVKQIYQCGMPYVVVATITGTPEKSSGDYYYLSTMTGIHYTFTQHVQNGKYLYSSLTGATGLPVTPVTNICVACPDKYRLAIQAPLLGEIVDRSEFSKVEYCTMCPPEEVLDQGLKKAYRENPARFRRVLTKSSTKKTSETSTFAWEIAYVNDRPTENVLLTVKPSVNIWQLWFVEGFGRARYFVPEHPKIMVQTAVALYILAWIIVALAVIRPWWRRAGSPGRLWLHLLVVFAIAQLLGVFLIFCNGFMSDFVERHFYKLKLYPWLIWLLLVAIILVGNALLIRKSWRKWLAVGSTAAVVIVYQLLALFGYGLLHWWERV